jgi:dTDP-4-dehydrorhamnose 3,5-epimerase-like enzyme
MFQGLEILTMTQSIRAALEILTYDPQSEQCFVWNDPELGIDWPIQNTPLLSFRDAVAASMMEMSDLLFI